MFSKKPMDLNEMIAAADDMQSDIADDSNVIFYRNGKMLGSANKATLTAWREAVTKAERDVAMSVKREQKYQRFEAMMRDENVTATESRMSDGSLDGYVVECPGHTGLYCAMANFDEWLSRFRAQQRKENIATVVGDVVGFGLIGLMTYNTFKSK